MVGGAALTRIVLACLTLSQPGRVCVRPRCETDPVSHSLSVTATHPAGACKQISEQEPVQHTWLAGLGTAP